MSDDIEQEEQVKALIDKLEATGIAFAGRKISDKEVDGLPEELVKKILSSKSYKFHLKYTLQNKLLESVITKEYGLSRRNSELVAAISKRHAAAIFANLVHGLADYGAKHRTVSKEMIEEMRKDNYPGADDMSLCYTLLLELCIDARNAREAFKQFEKERCEAEMNAKQSADSIINKIKENTDVPKA